MIHKIHQSFHCQKLCSMVVSLCTFILTLIVEIIECLYITEWLLEKWVEYEKAVSELLDWVMTEAENFAREVTTRGDKGVSDHITSCEVSGLLIHYIYAYFYNKFRLLILIETA